MADPIAIISLVSNIITFIDFGFRIVSGTKSVRDATHGTTAEVNELKLIVADVRHSNERVNNLHSSSQQFSQAESRIRDMAAECEKLAVELEKTLATLKTRNGVRSRTLESARVFTRSLLKRGDIQDLRARLNSLDERIRSNLEIAMQRDQNSTIMAKVSEIEALQSKMGIRNQSNVAVIRHDILDLVEKAREDINRNATDQAAQLISIRNKLDALQNEQDSSTKQLKVLKSLYFPEISRRWSQIPKADKKSNAWINDPMQTSFSPWLESQDERDRIFYISGRAGSGKSTLMKQVYDSPHTIEQLKKWAGSKRLITASYYFWNSGTQMQKSAIGLCQSLLYQILKSAPNLIMSVCRDRLNHEVWEIEDINESFSIIARKTDIDARFCFFIDGLDEYAGEEKDIVRLLQSLLISKHVKICASSRPGRQYENFLLRYDRTLDIANFTRNDMREHIVMQLKKSPCWQKMVVSEPGCLDIVQEISARANGVWLWVWLVTCDIVKEVERNEDLATLKRIVNEFPEDLNGYFMRIIDRIPKQHREEMAQIFLIVIEQLRPLPLYAFAFLEEERKNGAYAIEAPIKSKSRSEIELKYTILKSRLRNRCGDLLIVGDDRHPVALTRHPVDFLHRTVRDFLRDFDEQLRRNVSKKFDPLMSLSKICLAMRKASGDRRANIPDMLYYARTHERRNDLQAETSLIGILDEWDRVNSHHFCNSECHWAYDYSPGLPSMERSHCSFLALAVESQLVKYVRSKLQADPRKIQKRGMPLLAYALQIARSLSFQQDLQVRNREWPKIEMFNLLLRYGADPNQDVDGRSVWALLVMQMNDYRHANAREDCLEARFQSCRAMLQAGARSNCLPRDFVMNEETVRGMLRDVFGRDKALILEQEMAEKVEGPEDNAHPQQNSSCLIM